MAQFWLATFAIRKAPAERGVVSLFPVGIKYVAIEVLRDADEWAILFSSVDKPESPRSLTCHLGLTNVAKACNVWLDRGFPLIDADIAMDPDGILRVVSPFFARGSDMHYTRTLLSLSGVVFSGSTTDIDTSTGPDAGQTPAYDQYFQAPDTAQPDAFVARVPVSWSPKRRNVRRVNASAVALDLGDPPSRCPTLVPLTTEKLQPIGVWVGDLQLPTADEAKAGSGVKPTRIAHTFGPPAFRFEDVEVFGFRLNLGELVREFSKPLEDLVRPLNFHLAESVEGARGSWHTSRADFRYRAATATLVIELLRYGRMKARVPTPPLEIGDSQGQHELLVRVLVGRVDDDTAQAHSPAVFVPAIFVDNPWSKSLGRETIGFDKRLAQFCVRRDSNIEPLLPNGRLVARVAESEGDFLPHPEPLGDVVSVNLVERTGRGSGKPVFELTLPQGTGLDTLAPLDLDSVLGTSAFFGTRWRQSDFGAEEFRRSFASAAVAASLRAFRTIQVAPLAPRGALKHTWIGGTMEVDADVRADLPSGNATLTLHSVPPAPGQPTSSTPDAWNMICKMLGSGGTARVVVQSGSWYRLSCSMDLTIDDGLDWR